jgi:glycosyltransferase involved in cell wall biosynthesis
MSGRGDESGLDASVIIPTHNRPQELQALLDSLSRQANIEGIRWETIVVDDGSADPVKACMESYLTHWMVSPLRSLSVPKQDSVSRVRNLGVAHSRGAVLLFLDDDLVLHECALAETLHVHKAYPEIQVLNGLLKKVRDDFYSEFWHYYYHAMFNQSLESPYPVRRVSGGLFSIKRTLLEKIFPLFDESLPSREDLDLYLRLQESRIVVYKDDRIIAYHDFRRGLGSLIRQRIWYERGETALRQKYGSARLKDFYRCDPRVPRKWKFLPLNLVLVLARCGWRLRLQAARL